MKNILFGFLTVAFFLSGCDLMIGRRVKGNGNIITQDRNIRVANKIKLAGSYDVEIAKGSSAAVKVEADDNLMPHIIVENEGDWLIIKSRDHERLISDKTIKIYITTDELEAVELAGSGNIIGKDKFTGNNKLDLSIAGSGDMNLDINTPRVKASIAGSGNIILSGETKDQEIHIAGHGDYKAENLKSENAEVHIAGSGNVNLFADNSLTINIAGSGDVFYRGNPKISQHIAGSGQIKQLQ
ncbi:MAG: DUF2807 domain-containing protein [Bacteroidota bacterium]|nr:DUF2807 domain-containing protein [Bacteroidota bacterium]